MVNFFYEKRIGNYFVFSYHDEKLVKIIIVLSELGKRTSLTISEKDWLEVDTFLGNTVSDEMIDLHSKFIKFTYDPAKYVPDNNAIRQLCCMKYGFRPLPPIEPVIKRLENLEEWFEIRKKRNLDVTSLAPLIRLLRTFIHEQPNHWLTKFSYSEIIEIRNDIERWNLNRRACSNQTKPLRHAIKIINQHIHCLPNI